MKKMKVKGHPDLVRDSSSGAVVSNDRDGYEKYMETYRNRQAQRARVDNIEEDLSELKGEIQEIKSLLKQLVGG